jgi:hypothetical protein
LWDQSIYDERYSYDGAHQAVWVDYDRDGDLDLFYMDGLLNFLYQNQGDGTFVSGIEGTGLKDDSSLIPKEGATWCDVNNDGFPDVLFKSAAGGESLPILFINSADGVFQGVSLGLRFEIQPQIEDASWMDYDRDGLVDLFICNGPQLLVCRNNGNSTFSNRTAGSGVEADSAANVGLSWSDYDNDGDMDLYVARIQGFEPAPSSLYRLGSDATFTNIGSEAGVQVGGMVQTSVWGDYNRDGFSDLYIVQGQRHPAGTSLHSNLLFRNRGDGTFEEVSAAAGVNNQLNSQTATWVDFDNDGWPDLHVVNFNFQFPDVQPDRLYRNNGDGTFTDLAPEAGINHANNGGHASWADYDRDGDMDLFMSYFRFHTESGEVDANLLYRNESQNNWIEINLEPTPAGDAVGTKVIVHAAGQILKREAVLGSVSAPQVANRLLVGLGANSQAESIIVSWNSGQNDTAMSIQANSILYAKEGKGINTSIKTSDPLPLTFSLSPNFPNPLRSETSFRYELQRPGHVLLTIYDVLGERISTLVDQWQTEGTYAVKWNGQAQAEKSHSASGVYFYELRVGASAIRKKMVLFQTNTR